MKKRIRNKQKLRNKQKKQTEFPYVPLFSFVPYSLYSFYSENFVALKSSETHSNHVGFLAVHDQDQVNFSFAGQFARKRDVDLIQTWISSLGSGKSHFGRSSADVQTLLFAIPEARAEEQEKNLLLRIMLQIDRLPDHLI